MQITTALSLFGAIGAALALAKLRMWTFSLAFVFSAAYVLFDKVFPSVLPEMVVESFSFMFLMLVCLHVYQDYTRRKKLATKV